MISYWKNFKKNRCGYYSLWIFLCLFIISLFAEIIANDCPLMIVYKQKIFFPVFYSYPETTFGGDFPTPTNYKDPYIQNLIADHGWSIWPLIPFSYDTIDYQLSAPPPTFLSTLHWLGTDDHGRDILARIIYAFRISVLFGIILSVISSLIGIIFGALQGFYGGWIDLLGQRFIEIWSGLPMLFLLIILSSFIQPNFYWLLGIMSLFSWMSLVGFVRVEFLKGRSLEYVLAARAIGLNNITIMFRHILPNAMVSTITFFPFIINSSIIALTSLDFLGFGMPIGSASLGELLAQGKANLQAPWIGISVFIVLALLLSLLIFIGEAARNAFDPKSN